MTACVGLCSMCRVMGQRRPCGNATHETSHQQGAVYRTVYNKSPRVQDGYETAGLRCKPWPRENGKWLRQWGWSLPEYEVPRAARHNITLVRPSMQLPGPPRMEHQGQMDLPILHAHRDRIVAKHCLRAAMIAAQAVIKQLHCMQQRLSNQLRAFTGGRASETSQFNRKFLINSLVLTLCFS